MKLRHFLHFLFLLSASLTYAQRPELAYEQEDFDSFGCCWRKLNAEKHYAEAAAMLEDYVLNSPNATNKHSLYWHTGQMYAAADDTDMAVKYMKKTYTIFYKWFGDKEWYYFVKANVAFLERDRKKLEKIIARWEDSLPKEGNYNAILKLLQNWEKPYAGVFN